MRVLAIIPPMVPSYFNAGHHLPVFQVGQYLREKIPGAEVTCVDAAALNYTWRDVCHLLADAPDVVCVMNDLDGIDGFPRFMRYVREFAPRARTVTFGRLSGYIPRFFERYLFDGIVCAGDYESAVCAFLTTPSTSDVPGVASRRGGTYVRAPGELALAADEWVFPDVSEIPYSAYDVLYGDDLRKFCGIPERRELVVPIARGCPINCAYCDVPLLQGRKERRVAVEIVLDYIQRCLSTTHFEYVSFYAPTFTLNRRWVLDFCRLKRESGLDIPWKCVTTLSHIDTAILDEMARAGCVRVSIGLETLDPSAAALLPPSKRAVEDDLRGVLHDCAQLGIELNCFLMLGMPAEQPEGVQVHGRHAVARGSSHSTNRLHALSFASRRHVRARGLDAEPADHPDVDGDADGRADKEFLYRVLYRNGADIPTNAMHRIPVRFARSAPPR